MLGAVLLGATIAGLATMGGTGARADGEVAISIAAIDDSLFPQVTVVFTVDDGGRPVTHLAPTNVVVTETGASASIVSVQSAVDATMPLALVVAIDSSGSMAGAPIERARDAASSLIASLGSGDSVALIAFADTIRPIQSLTTDKTAAARGLATVQAGGNTALYDAVAESARIATDSGFERRAVVLLADGEDFGKRSTLSRDQSLARAADGGVLFYVIGVGSEIDRGYLEELATRSGGRFFEARGAAEIPAIYASLEQILRSQFVANLRATSPPEPRDRSLTVTVRSGDLTGSASRVYQSRRLAGATQLAPSAAVATAEPDVETTASAGQESQPAADTGVSMLMILAPVLLLAAAIAVWANGWLRPRLTTAAPGPPLAPVLAGRAAPGAISGSLILLDSSGRGEHFDLSSGPALIGSGQECRIRVPESPAVADQHARVWLRDSRRPMLHHLAPGFVTTVNGETVAFASLNDGDRIEIGPYAFVYDANGVAASTNLPSIPTGLPVLPDRSNVGLTSGR